MRVTMAVVGRPRDVALAAAIAEYERRAGRYWSLETAEVREESARSLDADQVRQREAERLAARVPHGSFVVACDERGRAWTSEAFAAWMGDHRDSARELSFVIGGAYGLHAGLRERANASLALASWTLPHELARLVLTEQLYRAGTLLRGEPYHK